MMFLQGLYHWVDPRKLEWVSSGQEGLTLQTEGWTCEKSHVDKSTFLVNILAKRILISVLRT